MATNALPHRPHSTLQNPYQPQSQAQSQTQLLQQQQQQQQGEESLTLVERELLDEYARLAENLKELSTLLADLASRPSADILDALRGLERKTATVFTLLKASVYSIVLQQQIFSGDGDGDGNESGLGE